MEDIKLDNCLDNFPLRISITDYCNLHCFFCSNEGMPACERNIRHADKELVKELISMMAGKGLKKLSLTGGDPTLHPDLPEILSSIPKGVFKELFFHTNGALITDQVSRIIADKFTKIAISIHAAELETWNKITGGTPAQFENVMKNIERFSSDESNAKLELKYVPIRGLNDSDHDITAFLDLCSRYNAKFKFLNFEPITENQIETAIHIDEMKRRLEDIGCIRQEGDASFRGQTGYLPFQRFSYKETTGVLIEIGCGEEDVCRNCYMSNEVFVDPSMNIKPCHIDPFIIPIAEATRDHDDEKVAEAILESRRFLKTMPGLDKKTWKNE